MPYPYKGVLCFDKLTSDGKMLRPYAARKDCEQWIARLYLPFERTYSELPERFIALTIATAADVRARAGRQTAA